MYMYIEFKNIVLNQVFFLKEENVLLFLGQINADFDLDFRNI